MTTNRVTTEEPIYRQTTGRKSKIGKRSRDDFTQTSVYIPKKLHRQLRIAMAEDDLQLSELAVRLFSNWLQSRV